MKNKVIVYDLESNPNSFDAFVFFIIFKINFNYQYLGIKNIIVIYPKEKIHNEVDEEKYHRRAKNLIPSIIKLHFGDIDITFIKNRLEIENTVDQHYNIVYPIDYDPLNPKPTFELKNIIDNERDIKPFQFHLCRKSCESLEPWLSAKNYNNLRVITITLRLTNYQTERNSDLSEWEKVANKISKKGFLVVFIPDIESENKLNNLRKLFLFCDPASQDLQIRLALYEKSYLNLVINHGPSSICLFNHNCSYLYFKPIVDAVRCSSLDSLEKQGWMPGEQWPGADCHQKIIWYKDDSFIIHLAFETFVALKEKKQVTPLKEKLRSKINTLLEKRDYTVAEKHLIVFDSMFDEPDFSSLNLFKLYCKRGKYRFAFFFAKKALKHFGMKELQMHLPKGLRPLLPIFINRGKEWDMTFQNQEDIIGNFDKSLNYHIHGTGSLAKKTYKYLHKLISIRGFTDNYKSNESNLNGLNIVNPRRLINNENVVIIIASQFYKDIIFDLLEIGFSLDSIAVSNLDPNVDF